MRLAYTDEQLQLREALAEMLAADTDDALPMLSEMGVLGLPVSEELDGAGAGLVELGLVAGELARGLSPSAFVPSAVVATLVLAECEGGESALRRIVTGVETATVPWSLVDADARPLLGDGGPVTLENVPFASTSDRIVVALDGAGIVSADLRADGVVIEELEALDPTEPLFRVTLDLSVADVVASDASAVLARALPRIAAVVAAELVACGEGVLRTAVEYATVRTQFGRAIGSFQAVKHMLADAHIALDGAGALAHFACATLDDGGPDGASLAGFALAAASAAAQTAAANSLQTFGGIGYTWEQGTHAYLRRVTARAAQFGTADRQLARIADALVAQLTNAAEAQGALSRRGGTR
jgi:alkylation response protein AidB-like acyl-CoA dehydrogenase